MYNIGPVLKALGTYVLKQPMKYLRFDYRLIYNSVLFF